MENVSAIVELKVRSMEHGITAALTEHEASIQKHIREAVAGVCNSFDFKSQVERESLCIMSQELRQALEIVLRPRVRKTIERTMAAVVKKLAKRKRNGNSKRSA